ncbi:unnamed protein product [Orchesella dallaii]|uniref:Thaumatin-like protein n=1 Tax=Orchesella dallaii TaxID=48710 RepID=A0ABP1RWC7_9HEXA
MKSFTHFAILLLFGASCLAEELTVRNNCPGTLYVKNEGTNSGSFTLGSGQSRAISINRGRSARVWAHAGCNGASNCDTTEGYVSLAEMFWDNNGMTWYDVSQVDGYTLPIRMEPYNPAAGGNCQTTSCNFNIDANCPNGNKVGNKGRTVGCRNPNRDSGNTDYARAIKRSCPGVYSWSQDDRDGMRACQPGNNGLRIIFC